MADSDQTPFVGKVGTMKDWWMEVEVLIGSMHATSSRSVCRGWLIMGRFLDVKSYLTG